MLSQTLASENVQAGMPLFVGLAGENRVVLLF